MTDNALRNIELSLKGCLYYDDIQIIFATLHMTDGDVLQFAVYNFHNGYYGHEVVIVKGDKVLLNTAL